VRGLLTSLDRRWASLLVNRALQAQGNNDEARAAFRSAAEHLEKTLGPDHPDSRAAHASYLLNITPFASQVRYSNARDEGLPRLCDPVGRNFFPVGVVFCPRFSIP
jgi:hypothetical protein